MPRISVLARLALTSTFVCLPATAAQVGNIDCGDAEYFKPFEFIENTTDGPNGTNVGIIADGYFIVIFAPDSGNPPGEIGVYDISNPRAVKEVKHVENGDTSQFREAHSLPVAIIGDKEYVAIQTTKGVQIWDISDPLKAARISKLDLSGIDGGDYDNVAWQATWQGRYLYVAGSNQGIYVIDTIDPKAPKLLKQVPNSKTGGFRVGPLYALGDYMMISNMDENVTLAVLDISKPDAPALLGQKSSNLNLYTTLAGTDRFYGAGRDGFISHHSFADPTEIGDAKKFQVGGDVLYVASQDNAVFAGRQDDFVKVDVSDDKNWKVVGEGTLGRDHPDHGQVTPFGNLVYIGNDHGSGSAFFCHQRGTDKTPPSIDRILPADGSVGVAATSRVSIAFSDYIDTRTVNPTNINVRKSGGETLPGIFTFAFNMLSFSANQPFEANTTYEIVLPANGVKDVMGNGLAEQTIARFSTGDSIVDRPDPGQGGGSGTIGTGGSANGSGGSNSGSGGTQPSSSGSGGSVSSAGTSSTSTGGGVGRGGRTSNPDDNDEHTSSDPSCSCHVAPANSGWATSLQALFAVLLFGLRRRASKRS